MPAWMIAAMRLLAPLVPRSRLGAGITGVGAGTLLPDIGFPSFGGGDEDGRPRRRRRRKALTASDRADIAFIEATLGKAAGRSFAMLVVSRTAA